ncbi:MAG: glycosyl hydrolase family 18 protein [Bacillota bacterium]|nr:glycosyl hydrolase family 18 protein [Bacillota bacterium]
MKQSRKRGIFLAFCALLLVFSLTACGEEKKEAEEPPVYHIANSEAGAEVRYQEGSFLDYEAHEKEIGITGAFDEEEGVFSYFVDGQKRLANVDGGKVVDAETGLDAAIRFENGRAMVEPETFLTHFGFTIRKEDAETGKAKDTEKEKDPEAEKDKGSEDVSEAPTEPSEREGDGDLKDIERSKQSNKIVMAWDSYVNDSEQTFAGSLDVVIAKAFALKSEQGEADLLLRDSYVRNAKRQGKEVWIMATNSFNPDLTKSFLHSYASRQAYIQSIVNYCVENRIEGVSLDFENMYLDDSDLFVQFVAELYYELNEHQKYLGVCVTVPGGSDMWSKVYDRERLGNNADYLMLMAYDQHWAASQVAGPVASYTWVKQNIEKMSEFVDKEKLILGVPFYTRVWYESYSNEVANKVVVRSKDFYMVGPSNLLNALEEGQYKRIWDDEASQFFFVYHDDAADEVVKFWFDDADSVARKANLANEMGLPGIACWALGFETPETWEKLDKVKRGEY